MSAISDKYERDVATYIDSQIRAVHADRPRVGSDYSDVRIKYKKAVAWLEVKMAHDNALVSSRLFYKDGKWQSTYKTNVATEAIDHLEKSDDAKAFIKNLVAFLRKRKLKTAIDLDNIMLSTTATGMREKNAVQREDLDAYFAQPTVRTKYIMILSDYNIGQTVTEHYNKHKSGGGAFYIQTGDDFLLMGDGNPLEFKTGIPSLEGRGYFKVGVRNAKNFYEILTELKIRKMPYSTCSFKPGTKKDNPFLNPGSNL